jgi:hypothetical protein
MHFSNTVSFILDPLLNEPNDRNLQKAACSCPWMNAGFRRYNQILSNIHPFVLKMVTEKIKYIGNCILLNLNGISVSHRMRCMCSIRTVSKFIPAITWASTMCLCKCIIVNFVLLERSYDDIRFDGSITATPTFSFSLWRGIPLDITVGRPFVSHVNISLQPSIRGLHGDYTLKPRPSELLLDSTLYSKVSV